GPATGSRWSAGAAECAVLDQALSVVGSVADLREYGILVASERRCPPVGRIVAPHLDGERNRAHGSERGMWILREHPASRELIKSERLIERPHGRDGHGPLQLVQPLSSGATLELVDQEADELAPVGATRIKG